MVSPGNLWVAGVHAIFWVAAIILNFIHSGVIASDVLTDSTHNTIATSTGIIQILLLVIIFAHSGGVTNDGIFSVLMNVFFTLILNIQFLLSYFLWSISVVAHPAPATINLIVTLIATCMSWTFYITFISVSSYKDDNTQEEQNARNGLKR